MAQNVDTGMKCVEIPSFGAPTVLSVTTRDRPSPAPNEVIIKVAAAGVNYPDILQRQGRYNVPEGASDLPGLEVAGEIVELGANVSEFNIGDKVCALTPGGGYAEYCRAPQEQCLPVPTGISMTSAASLPEVYFTVWFNLVMQGKLSKGQSLLVHGGSGGIGTAAIQLASNMGVTVYTTAGSDEKCDFCKKLGAHVTVNYKTSDFVDVISLETNGKGVDMILDMVGGEYINKNLECLAQEGRLINLFFMKGSKAEIDMMPVLVKNLTITGSLLRPQPTAIKAKISAGLKKVVWPMIEEQKIKAVVYNTFSMENAFKAHELMENSQHIGKIVLKM